MSGIGIHNTNIYFLYGRITAQEWKRTLNVVLKYSIPPAATLDVMQNTRNETLETHTKAFITVITIVRTNLLLPSKRCLDKHVHP